MASTHFFIEDPGSETSAVLDWFRGLEVPPTETPTDWGLWLQFGDLARKADDSIDLEQSPLVALVPARVVRGVLWTVGEVRFPAKASSVGGRKLKRVQQALREWMSSFEPAYEQLPASESAFAYYLEGGIQNVAAVVHGLPSGIAALRHGQYFVSHEDNDAVLDRVSRTLKLRGVDCAPAT